jgi:hypothetical protein
MKRKHHSIDPHASVRNQIQTKDKIFWYSRFVSFVTAMISSKSILLYL